MSYSFKSVVDGGADTDLIYYNATLISSQTSDIQSANGPNLVRFNETRDSPIIKDAAQYYFSIVRFSMNGPGKNLPLFIPLIQTNGFSATNQSDPNLTIYYTTLCYQRRWNYTNTSGAAVTDLITLTPQSTAISYISETQNSALAPVPTVPAGGFAKQDISTRYYWVYSFKHWVQLVNNALSNAMYTLWQSFNTYWASAPTAQPTPYPTYDSFLLAHDAPSMAYNETTGCFEIYGDTRAFNVTGQIVYPAPAAPQTNGYQPPLPAFTPAAYNVGDPPAPDTEPYIRLFFNDNLFGLFTNFNNTFLGQTGAGTLTWPLTNFPLNIGGAIAANNPVYLYTTEILFANQQYQNILNNNPGLQNNNGVPPPIYNPFFLLPTEKQNLYWIAKQDYQSTGSLWSPVASIVFTSSLLPLKKEYSANPIRLGTTNTAGSTNSPSAFDPIISDMILDQRFDKAEGYRDFVLYEPTAEYRMVSMNASHEEIRNIDIQVSWRYRLTGELIPLSMYNCSDVTIKMLFRKIDYRS
jgi:hypothetical protein